MHTITFFLSVIAGGILSGLVLDRYGRKVVVIVNSLISITGWSIIVLYKYVHFHNQDFGLDRYRPGYSLLNDYTLVLVYGFCATVFEVAIPVYLVEVSPTDIRGFVGSCYKLFVNIGTLLVPTLYIYFYLTWIEIAWGISSALLLLIIMFFIPETPRWLMSQGYREKAVQALKTLWSSDFANIVKEIEEIPGNGEQSTGKVTYWKNFVQPTLCRRMCIVFGLMSIQQISTFTGWWSNYQYLNPMIFYPHKRSDFHIRWYVIITGLGSVLPSLVSAFLVDRLGRRVMLITSAAIMTTSMIVMGILSSIFDRNIEDTDRDWFPILSLFCYTFGYHIGFGTIPLYMASELLPQRIRGITCGIIIASYPSLFAIVYWCFPNLPTYLFTEKIVYWVLAGTSSAAIIFTLTLVPETRKITLEGIENYFTEQLNSQPKKVCPEQNDLLKLTTVV